MQCPASLGSTLPTVFHHQRFQPSPTPSFIHGIGFNLLFIAGVGAASAWFSVATPTANVRYHLSIQTNVPGWRFEPIPLNEKVVESLANPNFLNGIFLGPNNEKINIFFGEWVADKSSDLNIVSHTPEVCWVNSGWMAIEKEKSEIVWPFGENVGFKTKTFLSPQTGTRQIAAWATIVNGKSYDERPFELQIRTEITKRVLNTLSRERNLSISHFLNALKTNNKSSKSKQFLRISVDGRQIQESAQEYFQPRGRDPEGFLLKKIIQNLQIKLITNPKESN